VKEISQLKPSVFLKQFDPNCEHFIGKEFMFVSPDFESEVKQLGKITCRNLETPIDLDPYVINRTFKIMVDILKYHGVESHEIPLGAVSYNRNGSCGFGLDKVFPNKGALVDHGFLSVEYPIWREQAHRNNWPVPFVMSGKGEILPKEKVNEKDVRVFEFPHAYHYFSCAQDFQKFNKLLYKMDWLIGVGKRFQYGGLHKLIKMLMLRWGIRRKFITGDVSKFDKWFKTALMNICRLLRLAVYTGSDPEYTDRVNYQYIQDMFAYIILGNGQVIQVFGSQLSGRENTTSDNCLGHMFTLVSMIIHFCEPEENSFGMFDIMQLLCGAIYADDNLLSLHCDISFLAPFEVRAEFYERYGWLLKLQDDAVQDTVEGLTFLGAEIIVYKGFYVPRYKEARLRAGFQQKRESLTASQEYAKALALYILGAFCSKAYTDYCYKYCVYLHKQAHGHVDLTKLLADDDDLTGHLLDLSVYVAHSVPSLEEVRSFFWLNLENSGKEDMVPAWLPGSIEPKVIRSVFTLYAL